MTPKNQHVVLKEYALYDIRFLSNNRMKYSSGSYQKFYIIIKFEMGGLCDRIHSEVTPNIGENV